MKSRWNALGAWACFIRSFSNSFSRSRRLETGSSTGKPWRPDNLQVILADPVLLSCFRGAFRPSSSSCAFVSSDPPPPTDYLAVSHCDEHLTALLLCADFRLVADDVEQGRHVAEVIIRDHLAPSAESPVNIEACIRKRLFDSFVALGDGPVPSGFFEAAEIELVKLLTQDCFGRFVLSGEVSKNYLGLLEFCQNAMKRYPEEETFNKLVEASRNWPAQKTLMPDIEVTAKKHSACGTLILPNCVVQRVLKMVVQAQQYPDWIPDIDAVDESQSFDYGTALSVSRLKSSKLGTISLAVCRMSWNYFGACIAWQTCLTSDSDVSGCFFLDFDPRNVAVKVTLVLTLGRTRMGPSDLVQSVLLGMLLAIGGQCEGKDATDVLLERNFSFLRRL